VIIMKRMHHKYGALTVLILGLLVALSLGAAPAVADIGWPGVGTPHVAHVQSDGGWWAGGAGWGNDWTLYDPGTPIPSQYSISMYMELVQPDKPLMERLPELILHSVTVKGADGILLETTEAQSGLFWYPVKWYPAPSGWWRGWEAHVGQLPPGTYRVTWVQRLTETVQFSYLEDDGTWVPFVMKPVKDVMKFRFTVL
jgi:hypothetical protein